MLRMGERLERYRSRSKKVKDMQERPNRIYDDFETCMLDLKPGAR